MNQSSIVRIDTPWTRRLQLLTAIVSVGTTVGTALVLGYVTPEVLSARTELAPADLPGFLLGFRVIGFGFLVANAIGIAALWNQTWIFYLMLVTNLAQGIGMFTVDFAGTGHRDLAVFGTYLTDGGGGLLGLLLLAFGIRYRGAWARRRLSGGEAGRS